MREESKKKLIENMAGNLSVLRAKLNMTQEQLGLLIGVSRQTVIAIETKKRSMTWNTFLSLVFVFSKNRATADLMRVLNVYTDEFNDYIKDFTN